MQTFEVATDVYGINLELYGSDVISVYLFDDEEPTLIDTGAAATTDDLLYGLRKCGVYPSEIENIVLSHIHVDHSGGAYQIAKKNKDIDIYIHEMTALHLSNPSDLIKNSQRAMGEHFQQMGKQKGVPASQITTVFDGGDTIDIGKNSLELIYAPGHSPDHMAVWNPEQGILFAAECLGLYFEEANRWLPPSSVPNFNPDMLEETIVKLQRFDSNKIVFPHKGTWPNDPERAFSLANKKLTDFGRRVLEIHNKTQSVSKTKEIVADELIRLSSVYNDGVESFYTDLIVNGYLKYHEKI